MPSLTFRRCLLTLSLLALVGCNTLSTDTTPSNQPLTEPSTSASTGSSNADSSSTDASNPNTPDRATADKQTSATAEKPNVTDTKDKPKPIAPAIAPGKYCYQANSEEKDLYARITVDAADRITGDFQGSIHDDKNSYYTSYRQKLNGTIDGSNLNLDVATWIEFDKQNSQEIWKVTSKGLSTERDTLSLESCETVSAIFQQNGLEADDLTSSANQVLEQEVFFDAGKSSTTVSNAVVRGDRDLYRLTAQSGQQMALTIRSLEDNAVFDVISPSGIILLSETTEDTLYLPETGEYQIVVGGTRGNASYDLEIAIE
ncbi:MAG: hypothetical protein AB8B99_15425 [Phormidesmis sp.]